MRPESARLTFREMTPDDLDDMALLLGDPEVMTYYPRPKTRDEAVQWIKWNRALYRTHGYGLWLLSTAGRRFRRRLRPHAADGGWRDRAGGRLPRAARTAGPRLRHRGGGRLAGPRRCAGATRLIAIIHPDNKRLAAGRGEDRAAAGEARHGARRPRRGHLRRGPRPARGVIIGLMRFRATVELNGKTATGIEVPEEVVAGLGGGQRPPVRVSIGGHSYRTTVARMHGRFLIPL